MSYIAINYSRKKRHCAKCKEFISANQLHVEVINQRTTFICATCIKQLSEKLLKERGVII